MNRFSTPLLFITIIIFSLIFRITNMDVIEFKADEGVSLFLASRPLFGHAFPAGASVSSVGILNSPLFNYTLFPILLISLYPPTVSFFVGLLNSIAIGFLFLIFKKISNISIALIASILMAFSPWSILFSRKIWNPDFLVIFFIPILFSLYKIKTQKKGNYWLIFTAFSFFLIQIHLPSAFFILLLLISLIISKTTFNFKYITIGLIVGFLPMVPYLLFEFSNNCPDCKILFSVENRFAVNRSLSLFLRPLQIISSGNFQYVLGDDMLTFASKFPLIFQARKIFYIEYLLLPIGAFIFYKKFKEFNFIVIASFFLPVIYFLFRVEPLMHYFIAFSPLLFLFLATGFYHFFSYKNNYLKIIISAIFFSLIAESLFFNFAFFNILTKQKVLKGDYGTSFAISEKTTNEKFKKYKNIPDYKEMIIASYVPKEEMYGFLPFSKIVFPRSYSEDQIIKLENKLKNIPDDNLTQIELLSYYTRSFPNKTNVEFLRNKYKNNTDFKQIYEYAYNLYLGKNFRKSYSNKNLGISFEYPQHWKLKENLDKNLIILKNEESFINLLINPEETDLGKNSFKTFKMGGNNYSLNYKQPTNSTKQNLKDIQSILNMITESVREEI